MVEDTLVVLSIDTPWLASDNELVTPIRIRHRGHQRKMNLLYHLSGKGFQELNYSLSVGDKHTGKLPAVVTNEILQLQYAASLLRRYVSDFNLMDIIRLYRSNKKLLRPIFYLKREIRGFRHSGRKSEAYTYSSLLKKLKEYDPDIDRLDVEGMTQEWFTGFKSYLNGRDDLTDIQKQNCVQLFWRTYADVCRNSGIRVLYSVDGERACTGSMSDDDPDCTLGEKELLQLLSGNCPFKDEDLCRVCKLLLVKRQTGMSLSDLIDLREEDLYEEGIWYRRSRDNRLAFAPLPTHIVALLREDLLVSGLNRRLFASPYDGMQEDCMRMNLKKKWYICLQEELSEKMN